MALSMAACNNNETDKIPPVEQDKDISGDDDTKTLVVYFSIWSRKCRI